MNIQYKGTVTIKKYNKRNSFLGSWKIHNTGTAELFKFIANTLASEQFPTASAPYKLLVTDNSNNAISELLDRTSSPSFIENTSAVSYSFFLPYSRLLNPEVTVHLQNSILKLFPRDHTNDSDLYASIKVEDEISLSEGEYLSILWDLSFDNKETQPEPAE